jgi:hypothetical protein
VSLLRAIEKVMQRFSADHSVRIEATTHDFSKEKRTWGHDVSFTSIDDDPERGKVYGWHYGIKIGDYLILQNGEGTTRYQVEAIRYRYDPPDMFFATVVFAPRR